MGDTEEIRTMVVDDTVTYRKIMSDVVGAVPGLELVCTAPSGSVALQRIPQKDIQLVLLDLFMPTMDGIEVLERIRDEYPDVFVIMVSGATTRDAAMTIRGLEMGAIDFIPKPSGDDPTANSEQLISALRPLVHVIEFRRLRRRLRDVRQAPRATVKLDLSRAPVPVKPARRTRRTGRISLVVVGVSTGGPNALGRIIPQLPADLPVPILIVQHMPSKFTASLAQHLDKRSGLTVTEAANGDRIEPGSVCLVIARGVAAVTGCGGPGVAVDLIVVIAGVVLWRLLRIGTKPNSE